MKEIIKYLRQANSYTQQDVASAIGVTRQTYSKFESGISVPGASLVKKLADFYEVDPAVILENRFPGFDLFRKNALDSNTGGLSGDRTLGDGTLMVASDNGYPENFGGMIMGEGDESFRKHSHKRGQKTYEGVFDGNAVRILDPDSSIKKGQKFRLVLVDETAEVEKRRRAYEKLFEIAHRETVSEEFDEDDPFYKKALGRHLDERYGFN